MLTKSKKITRITFILVRIYLVLLMISCTKKEKHSTPNTIESPQKEVVDHSLETLLGEKKANFEAKASYKKKRIYAEGIQDIIKNRIVEMAQQEGDVAMDFSLKNAVGNQVRLYDELKKGPVILIWYRGGWCPYCNITLNYMQKHLEAFKKEGASLIALTPELPDKSLTTKSKNNLEFEVLSDVDGKIAKQYGVLFKLTDDVANSYELSFGLSNYNGNKNNELPLAATYVIGTDKVIKYAFLDADYRNRAEPSDILAAIKMIK